ncbi:hypothetical protein [Streptomyces sp. NBC_00455]|uniref:hypothetical protein n=1 Tax=Streptomyces sp. NBC_00455 TaxID=2903654 RepID=UPI002E1DD3F3
MPPPEETGGIDPRVEALADYISRTMELGAGIDDVDREHPGRSEQYRYLAEALVPWLVAAPQRELKDAWDRGFQAASASAVTP